MTMSMATNETNDSLCTSLQVLAGDKGRADEKEGEIPVHIRDRYRRSRLSALRYGCEINGILPSRGPNQCVFAPRCDVAQDDGLRHLCLAGSECPVEKQLFEDYVRSARKQYVRAREQLDPVEFELLIREASILNLRKLRLAARRREEGLTRRVRRRLPDGNYSETDELTLSNSRYMKAVDRKSSETIRRLLLLDGNKDD